MALVDLDFLNKLLLSGTLKNGHSISPGLMYEELSKELAFGQNYDEVK